MENKTHEKVDNNFSESMKFVRFASISAGSLPRGVRYMSNLTNHTKSLLLLVTFVLIFSVVVIWLELFNSPHNTIIEITRAIDLFTESFSSIMNLLSVMEKSRGAEKFWNLLIEADTICLSLGLDIDYIKLKRQYKIVFVLFFILHISFITADYYLLTHTSNHKFVLSSFLALAIYTLHNCCCLIVGCFLMHALRQRFSLLNTAMRSLQYVDIGSLLRELPLNKPLSQITVLTMRQRVENIISAHEKYVAVCDICYGLRRIHVWLQISSNVGVVTANLYAAISTVIDQQYDFCLIFHCLLWAIYRTQHFMLFVIVANRTANEGNHIASITHDVINSGRADNARNYLKHFSMQFLHKKLDFSRGSVFPLDYSSFYLVAANITEYLVICIQFKISGRPNNRSKTNNLASTRKC